MPVVCQPFFRYLHILQSQTFWLHFLSTGSKSCRLILKLCSNVCLWRGHQSKEKKCGEPFGQNQMQKALCQMLSGRDTEGLFSQLPSSQTSKWNLDMLRFPSCWVSFTDWVWLGMVTGLVGWETLVPSRHTSARFCCISTNGVLFLNLWTGAGWLSLYLCSMLHVLFCSSVIWSSSSPTMHKRGGREKHLSCYMALKEYHSIAVMHREMKDLFWLKKERRGNIET